jgi:hypothetical protein
MRKKRFSVEQMIGVLKQAEVGVPVAIHVHHGFVDGLQVV